MHHTDPEDLLEVKFENYSYIYSRKILGATKFTNVYA